ncbi:MAG: universal stress protein [Deltaproteobacteria bacterium]|nr:universal stress protein [Deltaproteobacteria bacterium]
MGPVVFATCLSKVSEPAASVARSVAAATGAALHVLHAIPPTAGFTGDAAMVAREASRARQESELQGAVEAFCLRTNLGLNNTRRILSGEIAVEIAVYANTVNASLLIVGTTAPTGLSAVLLGSVADEIMRRATVPVLIVRHDVALPRG